MCTLTFWAISPPPLQSPPTWRGACDCLLSRASGARSVCDVTLVDKNWLWPGRIYLWQFEGFRIAQLLTKMHKVTHVGLGVPSSTLTANVWMRANNFRSLLILAKNMSCLFVKPMTQGPMQYPRLAGKFSTRYCRKCTRFLENALHWTLANEFYRFKGEGL